MQSASKTCGEDFLLPEKTMEECWISPVSRMKRRCCRFECDEWSIDVIRAMETHLKLLQNAGSCNEEEEDCISDCSNVMAERATMATKKLEAVRLVEFGTHQAPLPKGWEQFLDLQTGRMYFVDWSICKKTRIDPRKLVQLANNKISSLLLQACAQRELQSEIETDNSLCVSELVSEIESSEEQEVQSSYNEALVDQAVIPGGIASKASTDYMAILPTSPLRHH